jgi:hypothetical protein
MARDLLTFQIGTNYHQFLLYFCYSTGDQLLSSGFKNHTRSTAKYSIIKLLYIHVTSQCSIICVHKPKWSYCDYAPLAEILKAIYLKLHFYLLFQEADFQLHP